MTTQITPLTSASMRYCSALLGKGYAGRSCVATGTVAAATMTAARLLLFSEGDCQCSSSHLLCRRSFVMQIGSALLRSLLSQYADGQQAALSHRRNAKQSTCKPLDRNWLAASQHSMLQPCLQLLGRQGKARRHEAACLSTASNMLFLRQASTGHLPPTSEVVRLVVVQCRTKALTTPIHDVAEAGSRVYFPGVEVSTCSHGARPWCS